MFDSILLRGIRRGSETALGQIIDRYGAYICVVIRNTVGEGLRREDIEEIAADVFFALWEHAHGVEKLKPWISATARNRARNKLREVQADLPLDEARMMGESYEMDEALMLDERREAVKSAIDRMEDPDREIFLRYYYEAQTTAAIGVQTGLTESAVKQRLLRGRKKLKEMLGEEVGGQ